MKPTTTTREAYDELIRKALLMGDYCKAGDLLAKGNYTTPELERIVRETGKWVRII